MSTPGDGRLAIIGDVHGNLDALEAVLTRIAADRITDGVVTGDLVGRGRRPEEVIRRLRATGWPCVAGNTDRRLVAVPRRPDHPRAAIPGTRRWARLRVSDGSLAWMMGLPDLVTLTVGGRTLAVRHGHPDDPRGLLDIEAASDDEIRAACAELGADAIAVGHTHRPVIRWVGRLLAINPGSVGEGVPDDRRPSWAVVAPDRAGGLDAWIARLDAPLAHVRGE